MIKRRLFNTVETKDSEERKKLLQEMFLKLVEEYRKMQPCSKAPLSSSSKKRELCVDNSKSSDIAVSNAKRLCVREDSLLSIGITTKQT